MMTDEAQRNVGIAEAQGKPETHRVKDWVDDNRTASGAIAGAAIGSIVPGIGTLIGGLVGAGIGFLTAREREKKHGVDTGYPPGV